jgi:hypothetical protein
MEVNTIGKIEDANRYFEKQTKKVYVERCNSNGIETFEQYLNYRYRDNCYYYSAFALMGLNCDDYLVRGFINYPDYQYYAHGWVEFKFNGKEYIFDSMIKGIILKSEWDKEFSPEITYRKTQQEILDEYLTTDNAVEITENFWQFKNVIDDDASHGYVLNALRLSRVEIFTWCEEDKSLMKLLNINPKEKVKRFIAYSEPSG